MFKSLRTKLILILSLLIIFLLSISAFLLIDEKTKELSRDIFLRGKSFAELATPELVNAYENLLSEGAFVLFNSKINEISGLNDDISRTRFVSFEGKLLFDSQTEKIEQYVGEERIIQENVLRERIKANNISFASSLNRVVYMKSDDGNSYAVDINEKRIPDVGDNERISTIVMPFKGKYAAIFDVSYELLNDRVRRTRDRIILLTVFGVLIGLAVGAISAGRIIGPLTKLKEAVSVIASGDFKKRVEVRGRDEVANLSESVNKMAEGLEKSTKALIYKERVAKELELAAVMQRQLLPKFLPDVKNLDVAAGIIPAAEVGGDLYDFIVPHSGRLLSYVGDVTGHGVPAAILGSIANALIFGLSHHSLLEILVEANKILHAKSTQNMFLTLLISEWNPETREFNYVSAGHEKMIFFRKETGTVKMLPSGGLAMGMIPDISHLLKIETIKPRAGDIAILYTDGIPEAWRDQKEMYGFDRFLHAVKHFSDLHTAEAVKNSIMADVKHFIGKSKQMDDITLIVYKWV